MATKRIAILLLLFIVTPAAKCGLPSVPEDRNKQPMPWPKFDATDFDLKQHVFYLAYSPKLNLLAGAPFFGSFKGIKVPHVPIVIWDLRLGKMIYVMLGQGMNIYQPTFHPTSGLLLTGVSAGMLSWDVDKGKLLENGFRHLGKWAYLSPSGKEFYQLDENANKIDVWDYQSLNKKRSLSVPAKTSDKFPWFYQTNMDISSNEKMIALSGWMADGWGKMKLFLWDYHSGESKATLEYGAFFAHLDFTSDGRYLVGAGQQTTKKGYLDPGVLTIWDTKNWSQVANLVLREEYIFPVAYAPKSELVLTVDSATMAENKFETGTRQTRINGYSVKTGKRVISFDPKLPAKGFPTQALYIDHLNAICIGGHDGKITFYSVDEVLKSKVTTQD